MSGRGACWPQANRPGSAQTRRSADCAACRCAISKVHFPIRKGLFKRTVGYVKAVDGVSLEIGAGARSGWSANRAAARPPSARRSCSSSGPEGQVEFGGVELDAAAAAPSCARDARDFQIIFQDPYASLNPRMRVADILSEGMASLRRRADAARAGEARRRDPRPGGARARLGRALSARILRRPAPAHRDRARAGGRGRSSSSATSRPARSTSRCRRRS